MYKDNNTGKSIDFCFFISANTTFRANFRLYSIEWCLLARHIHLEHVSIIFLSVVIVILSGATLVLA